MNPGQSRALYFLAAATLLVVALLLLLEPSSDDMQLDVQPLFPSVQADAVDYLVLQGSPREAQWAFEKVAGTWRIVEPFEEPADTYRVEAMARGIANLRARPLGDVANLAQFGLAPPRLALRFATEQGARGGIQLGADAQVGVGAYLKHEAGIFLSEDRSTDAFTLSLSEYRSHQVWDPLPRELLALSVTRGEQRAELGFQDGQWLMDGAPTDQEAVQAILRRVLALQILEFDLLVADEAQPMAFLRITSEDGEQGIGLGVQREAGVPVLLPTPRAWVLVDQDVQALLEMLLAGELAAP